MAKHQTFILKNGHLISIAFTSRKGTKRLSLRILDQKNIKLNKPFFVTQKQAIDFIKDHQDWIIEHLPKKQKEITSGFRITPKISLKIVISQNSRLSSSILGNELIVKIPSNAKIDSLETQAKIKRIIKAKMQIIAKKTLTPNFWQMANQLNQSPKLLKIKHLKTRWGSCNNLKQITLNSRLVQLENEYIEYVICHELAHLTVLKHSAEFWSVLEKFNPGAKQKSKHLNKLVKNIPDLNISL